MKKRLRRLIAGVADGPQRGLVRRLPLILVLTAALMVAAVLPAGATPPSGVNIEVETSLVGENPPAPFTATGPAVDDGVICPEGTVVNATGKVSGNFKTGFNFQGIKHFTCENGSGEFFVNLQARIFFSERPTKFQWNVVDGTDDYEDLHGAGSGVGLPDCGPDCVLDVYDGGLHIG